MSASTEGSRVRLTDSARRVPPHAGAAAVEGMWRRPGRHPPWVTHVLVDRLRLFHNAGGMIRTAVDPNG
ncbi:hypothetical protein [Pseudonocardia xishanensis]|uniref:Uncharacterized protein n=1 Tax=Pseudonocardia xishanensis TaxID=630995 RepID=A0ABP8RXP8_9PSEU